MCYIGMIWHTEIHYVKCVVVKWWPWSNRGQNHGQMVKSWPCHDYVQIDVIVITSMNLYFFNVIFPIL